MTLKQFRLIKIFTAMIISMFMGQAAVTNNYWLALPVLAIGAAVIFAARTKVKEIIADERDYEIAGRAARYSATVFSVIGSVLSLVFMSLRHKNPVYEVVGSSIAYLVCSYLLLYSLIFSFLNKASSKKGKIKFFLLALAAGIFFTLASLRFFSGDEDTWLCQQGQWVRHGQPRSPQPTTICPK